MKFLTHTAFGLFIGTIFHLGIPSLDVGFILLTGFAALLPDVDWIMQFKWGLGPVHRRLLHNVWTMLIVTLVVLAISHNVILALGVIVGFSSHLLTDSLTQTGIHWLHPLYMTKNRFFLRGQFRIGQTSEKYVQILFLTIPGFLFLNRGMNINPFFLGGVLTVLILFFVGHILYIMFAKTIKKAIRSTGL